ncbi:smx5 isoform X2 [Megalobrama amblycephala]|uniref:smx5 isoform X2 n=1 Tax=Megalobrama amblycephala TaxID=75352 RepID=UPI0020141EF3|nr:smx5 isoform X2 [Megalobrama amblycephala]
MSLMRMEKFMNEGFDMECCSEVHQSKMDEHIRKGYALTSILNELFEEKISTQKKNHWILGPEDLNDTLVHDFEMEEAA